MRISYLLFLIAILFSGFKSSANTTNPLLTDSLEKVNKTIKIVRIGPQELYLVPLAPPVPPVDSILLRKLASLAFDKAVDEGFRKKENEDISLKKHQNELLLQSLLAETETSVKPDESIIGTLAKALELYKKTGDLRSQSLIMNTYAVYYGRKGEMDTAIPYFQEALRLKELTKDKTAISKITINLAAIFKILGKYNESIAYSEYTVRINTTLKNQSRIAEAYAHIASVKALQEKYSEAEYYIIKKALPLFRSANNKNGRMQCFKSLADMYKLQSRFSEAKWFYLQTDAMAHILGDKKAQVSCLIDLAQVKNAIGDHDLALEDYKHAELLALQNNYADKLAEIKGQVGETYWKMGNYIAAGNALKEYTRLKDTLFGSLE